MTTVLLVEDQPLLRFALEEALALSGFQLMICSALSDCVFQPGGTAPDVIVTDFVLPDGNGCELIQMVRRICARRIPALLLSAWNLAQVKLPADTVAMRKPCDLDHLVEAINGLL